MWRNHYAIGALGPDLFYLLPDFKGDAGAAILSAVRWLLDVWQAVDDAILGPWEDWMGPLGANDADLAAALTAAGWPDRCGVRRAGR